MKHQKPRRILFVSPGKPSDIRLWSGTIHYLYDALERDAASSGYVIRPISGGLIELGARIANAVLRKAGIPIDCRFSTAYAVLSGVALGLRLLFVKDAILVAVAASNCVAYLRTVHPMIYISDATFSAISDFYPAFQAFPTWLKRQGDTNEKRALQKSRFIIYPSRWAAQSAECDYDVPADRIREIPFGPNIPPGMIERFRTKNTIGADQEIRILFVSADWSRKNGELVLAICQSLITEGFNIRLITIGDTPDHVGNLNFVDSRGFLSKSDPEQLMQLCRAYSEAHFFLMPSTADAFAIVFSEAQAFGVPSVAYDIGGVSSAIADGQTGFLLPLGTQADGFVRVIKDCILQPGQYESLYENCRQRYSSVANWSAWAALIGQLAATCSDAPARDPSPDVDVIPASSER